jgi:YbgC/YbaW family acyl-CoA thioester hydrolase
MIVPIEVRFTDVDSDNHVNHLAIAEWVAHARVKMIDENIKQAGVNFLSDINYVLVKLSIDFRDQVVYPNFIEVQGKILRVGTKSLTTQYSVYIPGDKPKLVIGDGYIAGDSAKIVAVAECVNVFVDATDSKKSIEIPDEIRRILDIEVNMWWPTEINMKRS